MSGSERVCLHWFSIFKILFYVYGSFVCMCVCEPHAYSSYRVQKVLDLPGHELQMDVSIHVVAKN